MCHLESGRGEPKEGLANGIALLAEEHSVGEPSTSFSGIYQGLLPFTIVVVQLSSPWNPQPTRINRILR